MPPTLRWVGFALAAALSGCAAHDAVRVDPPEPLTHRAYLVDHDGFHTMLVVKRADVAATGLLPEVEDFPDAAYLQFGWGDRAYYPTDNPSLATGLRALFTATPSVMNVRALPGPPEVVYPGSETVPFLLTPSEMRRMAAHIAASFDRGGARRAPRLTTATKRNYGAFYNAHGTYSLLRNCNGWAGNAARAGGLDMPSFGMMMPRDVIENAKIALGVKEPSAPCDG